MPIPTIHDVLAVYTASPLVHLPVVTSECWYCQHEVDLAAQATYTVSRINGDSRYGYEPCHNACSAALKAELAAEAAA